MTGPALPAWIEPRSDWRPVAGLGDPMPLPAAEVWLHHSDTRATDDPRADMRTLERIGIERFGLLSYSWAVHPSGLVLEGAGFTIGAHTLGHNVRGFGVVLIGDYQTGRPSPPMLDSVVRLLGWLRDVGAVRPGPLPTGGHRDVRQTACPGRFAYEQIPAIRARVARGGTPTPSDGGFMPALTDEQQGQLLELSLRTFDLVQSMHSGGFGENGGTPGSLAFLDARRDYLAGLILGARPVGPLDPSAIADAIADAVGPDLARQVVDLLAARLAP